MVLWDRLFYNEFGFGFVVGVNCLSYSLFNLAANEICLRFLIVSVEVIIEEIESLTSVAIANISDYLRDAGFTGVTKYDLIGDVCYQGVKLTIKQS